jgi:hypothetical protein
MAMNQRLDIRQSQSLVMTPQLQQAIKLLQYSNLERWARSAMASCIALALVAGSTAIILYSALVQQSEAAGIETILLTLAGIGMLVCG